MGIALLHGRLFAATDGAAPRPSPIVDDALARRWWPTAAAAVGQSIRIGTGKTAEIRTIVGVVRHVSHTGPGVSTAPTAYAPQAQVYQPGMYTVMETAAPPATVFAAAREALAAVDPTVPLYFAETSTRRYDDVVALPRFVTGLVGAFSTVALLLAGVGIFGVTGYAVSQRTREFGIRLALGAQQTGIGGLVLRRIAVLVALGLAAGSALALALGSVIGGLLHDVRPDDPSAFALSAVALGLTALVATVSPVRAAVRVDPAVTLKAEVSDDHRSAGPAARLRAVAGVHRPGGDLAGPRHRPEHRRLQPDQRAVLAVDPRRARAAPRRPRAARQRRRAGAAARRRDDARGARRRRARAGADRRRRGERGDGGAGGVRGLLPRAARGPAPRSTLRCDAGAARRRHPCRRPRSSLLARPDGGRPGRDRPRRHDQRSPVHHRRRRTGWVPWRRARASAAVGAAVGVAAADRRAVRPDRSGARGPGLDRAAARRPIARRRDGGAEPAAAAGCATRGGGAAPRRRARAASRCPPAASTGPPSRRPRSASSSCW